MRWAENHPWLIVLIVALTVIAVLLALLSPALITVLRGSGV